MLHIKDSTWDDAFTVVGYVISLNLWIFLVKQVHIIVYWFVSGCWWSIL